MLTFSSTLESFSDQLPIKVVVQLLKCIFNLTSHFYFFAATCIDSVENINNGLLLRRFLYALDILQSGTTAVVPSHTKEHNFLSNVMLVVVVACSKWYIISLYRLYSVWKYTRTPYNCLNWILYPPYAYKDMPVI